jgi:hypothetical protein
MHINKYKVDSFFCCIFVVIRTAGKRKAKERNTICVDIDNGLQIRSIYMPTFLLFIWSLDIGYG